MFQLTKDEFVSLKSQFVTSKRGGLRYTPYAFTEHGIVMLASLLKSKTAVEVSVRIINAFVAMRKFILANAQVFQRLESVEQRQFVTDGKVNEILNHLNIGDVPSQGVFFNGQLWDACSLIEKLISRAKTTILLIDNWIGIDTLDMLAKKQCGVMVEVITSKRGYKLAASDIAKFNAQYPTLAVHFSENFHDRFLVIDNIELYLIGASLKDLGKKCFGFTRMDAGEIPGIKARI